MCFLKDIRKATTLHQLLNLIRGLYKAIDEDWRKCASKSGLTVSQQHLLWILRFKDGSTLSEISQYGLWHLSTVMDLVERMEKLGLVYKEVDSKDARTKRVTITDKGNEFLNNSCNNSESFKFMNAMEWDNLERMKQYLDTLYMLNKSLNGDKFVHYVEQSAKKLEDELEKVNTDK